MLNDKVVHNIMDMFSLLYYNSKLIAFCAYSLYIPLSMNLLTDLTEVIFVSYAITNLELHSFIVDKLSN